MYELTLLTKQNNYIREIDRGMANLINLPPNERTLHPKTQKMGG